MTTDAPSPTIAGIPVVDIHDPQLIGFEQVIAEFKEATQADMVVKEYRQIEKGSGRCVVLVRNGDKLSIWESLSDAELEFWNV